MFNGIVVEPNIKCRSHVVFNPLDLLLRERRKDCSKVLNIYSILIPYLKFEFKYNSGFSLFLLGGYLLLYTVPVMQIIFLLVGCMSMCLV